MWVLSRQKQGEGTCSTSCRAGRGSGCLAAPGGAAGAVGRGAGAGRAATAAVREKLGDKADMWMGGAQSRFV